MPLSKSQPLRMSAVKASEDCKFITSINKTCRVPELKPRRHDFQLDVG